MRSLPSGAAIALEAASMPSTRTSSDGSGAAVAGGTLPRRARRRAASDQAGRRGRTGATDSGGAMAAMILGASCSLAGGVDSIPGAALHAAGGCSDLWFDCVNYTGYLCSSFDATVGRRSAALGRISRRSAEQRSHGEPDDPIMKVLIAGAGIAGLSLALRLRQRGLVPFVIERSARLRDGGYMLGLSDPGYDAAERMGIVKALEAAQY